MSSEQPTSRRRLLAAGGIGVGAAAIAACGNGSYQGSKLTSTPSTSAQPDKQQGAALVDVATVPVGGAVSATGPDNKPIVVAQPREGEFTAHSAICTHMGCTVKPDGELLRCPCHGSVYTSASGDVVNGPAERPLATIPVHVESGTVVTGPA